MKILLITHFWHTNSHHSTTSGYEQVARYLANSHYVDVLTPGTKNSTNYIHKHLRVITRKTPNTNYLFEKRLILSFYALLLDNDYDIVHALYSDVGFFPSFRYPVVITEHVLRELNPYDIWLQYKWFLQKLVFPRAKMIITVSTNLQNILKERYKLQYNVVTVPHGIDCKSFSPITDNSRVQKMRRRFLDNFKVICYSCGIQGVDSKSFIEIVKKFPQVLFIVTGRKEQKTYKNIVNTGKISEKELKEYYAIADFCFKPLLFATANNALLEAMAMGKVTVTNNIPGITDYVDTSCALLANNPAEFIEIFHSILQKKVNLDKLGSNARKKALENFSWESITPKILKIYKQVLIKTL